MKTLSHTRKLNGAVTLVQERRFQLVDDRGVAHLFLLAADADVDPRALQELAQSGARISVSYGEDTSGLIAHVATAIDRADSMEDEG
jgi:hypothetical protein